MAQSEGNGFVAREPAERRLRNERVEHDERSEADRKPVRCAEAERKLLKNPFVQPALAKDLGEIIRIQVRLELAKRLGLE